jgi:hypothetical protein
MNTASSVLTDNRQPVFYLVVGPERYVFPQDTKLVLYLVPDVTPTALVGQKFPRSYTFSVLRKSAEIDGFIPWIHRSTVELCYSLEP